MDDGVHFPWPPSSTVQGFQPVSGRTYTTYFRIRAEACNLSRHLQSTHNQ